jgi:hypothetical protein
MTEGQEAGAGPFVPASVQHSAKYEFSPAELAGLIGIKMPEGGSATVTHVSARGRVTSVPYDSKVVITVTWETGPEDAS